MAAETEAGVQHEVTADMDEINSQCSLALHQQSTCPSHCGSACAYGLSCFGNGVEARNHYVCVCRKIAIAQRQHCNWFL